jgi:hypothetical protein
VIFVPLFRGGRVRDHALVDEADAELLQSWRWNVAGGYAIAGARRRLQVGRLSGTPMHRFLLGLQPFEGVVHHLNEDRLDNRRANLIVVADALAHGELPHPRRDVACAGRRADLPPHERELLLARSAA